MSAGDVYEGVFDEALAHAVPRCHCCNETPAIGDLVTVWSSNWRVDARILKCPKCNGVPPAFAKRIEDDRGRCRPTDREDERSGGEGALDPSSGAPGGSMSGYTKRMMAKMRASPGAVEKWTWRSQCFCGSIEAKFYRKAWWCLRCGWEKDPDRRP